MVSIAHTPTSTSTSTHDCNRNLKSRLSLRGSKSTLRDKRSFGVEWGIEVLDAIEPKTSFSSVQVNVILGHLPPPNCVFSRTIKMCIRARQIFPYSIALQDVILAYFFLTNRSSADGTLITNK